MATKLSEQEIRENVRKQRNFYRSSTVSSLVVIGCIFIWAFSGGGYFWPIWVIMGLGVNLLIEAKTMGMLPIFKDIFPHLNPEWEEKEVKKILAHQRSSTSATSPTPVSIAKATTESTKKKPRTKKKVATNKKNK